MNSLNHPEKVTQSAAKPMTVLRTVLRTVLMTVLMTLSAGISALSAQEPDQEGTRESAGEKAMETTRVSALETTRRIADKVIRETRFEYEMVPLTINAGIIRINLDKDGSGVTEGVTYARAVLQADEETDGYLGLAYTGELVLFLNGRELFRGSSDQVELQEYTYNRYRFAEKIPVKWLKGENTLLVKCATGKYVNTVVVLPVNETDGKLPEVNALPATAETPDIHWLTNGDGLAAGGAPPAPPAGDPRERLLYPRSLCRLELCQRGHHAGDPLTQPGRRR
jgi:hypothetical protein